MRRLVHLSLILLLVVTATALGHARGQSRVAGQVVLCAGGTVTTLAVDGQGRPATTVVCPDMALSLLAGLPPEPPLAAPLRLARAAAWARPAAAARGRAAVPAQARGPPTAA